MPPSTANHNCPKTVFGKSRVANCPDAISGTTVFAVLVEHSLAIACPTALLSGTDCTSWTMGKNFVVTCAEGNRTVNETRSILTWEYQEVAGNVVLEVAESKCLSVVCSLDDQSTAVHHECWDIWYLGSWLVTCSQGHEAGGSISTTFLALSLIGRTRQRGTNSLFVVFADVLS